MIELPDFTLWLGQRVVVDLDNHNGEGYRVIGHFGGATDHGIWIDRDAKWPGGAARWHFYGWPFIVSVQLSQAKGIEKTSEQTDG